MRFISPHVWGCALVALVLGVTASPAKATYTVSFTAQDPNNPTNQSIAEAQVRVEVYDRTDGSGAKVGFRFINLGTQKSTITDVGFEDGTLLDQVDIVYGPSGIVGYKETTDKNSLNKFPFLSKDARNFFTDDPSDTPPEYGVNNSANGSEWAEFVFTLQSGKNYGHVLAAIQSGFDGPDYIDSNDHTKGLSSLRFAAHIQSFNIDGSEKLLGTSGSDPEPGDTVATPAPAGLVMLASAVPFLFGLRRRLTRREPAAA